MSPQARSDSATSASGAPGAIISSMGGVKLVCVECKASSDASARGWRAYVVEVDDDGEEDEVVFYCPRCAVREFGGRRRTS